MLLNFDIFLFSSAFSIVYNVDRIIFFIEKMKLNEKCSKPLLSCKNREIQQPKRKLYAKRIFADKVALQTLVLG